MDKRGARPKCRSRRAPKSFGAASCDMFHSSMDPQPYGQLFCKSRGASVVCGRIIEGRVLELYQELTDSPSKPLEEACVLSGIFALRYLSRDLAANVEPVDVRLCPYSARIQLTTRVLSTGSSALDKRCGRPHPGGLTQVTPRIHAGVRRAGPVPVHYLHYDILILILLCHVLLDYFRIVRMMSPKPKVLRSTMTAKIKAGQ